MMKDELRIMKPKTTTTQLARLLIRHYGAKPNSSSNIKFSAECGTAEINTKAVDRLLASTSAVKITALEDTAANTISINPVSSQRRRTLAFAGKALAILLISSSPVTHAAISQRTPASSLSHRSSVPFISRDADALKSANVPEKLFSNASSKGFNSEFMPTA